MMEPETSIAPAPSHPDFPESIQAIQNEIIQIGLHQAEHVSAFGAKVMRLDKSCKYCASYLVNVVENDQVAAGSDAEPPKVVSTVSIPEGSENTPKIGKIMKDLQRTVEHNGKRGQISVPRSWAGRAVRVTLLTDI